MRKRSFIRWSIGLFVVHLLAVPVYFTKISNTDIWKNLVTAQYLHYFHAVHHPSVFVTVPVKEFVAKTSNDWLGTLILYWMNIYGGWIVHNAIQVLPVLIVSGYLLYLVQDQYGLVSGLSATILVYCMSYRLIPRASIFGLCLLPVLLLIWYKFVFTRNQKWLWLIPPVLVIWSNLHGSYIVGGFILFGLFLGLLLEFGFFGYVRVSELRTVACVVLVLLLGILFVNLSPNTFLAQQSSIILGGNTVFFTEKGEMSESADQEWTIPTLKNFTHDLFLSNRPYVGHEFSYTLEKIERPNEYIFLFVLLPLFLLYLFLGFRPRSLSFLVGIFFSLWIGLAFQRALVYFSITVLLLIVPLWARYEENIFFKGKGFSLSFRTIFAAFIIFLSVWFLEISVILGNFEDRFGSHLRPYWEMGFGRHSRFKSDIPKKILRKYPDKKVFNELALGGILLYHWWPYKKVFWWPKTSDLAHSILRKRQRGQIGYKYFREKDITLSIVSFKFMDQERNPYELLPNWKLWERDQLMGVYCQCR